MRYRKKPVVIEAFLWDGTNHHERVPPSDYRFVDDPHSPLDGAMQLRAMDEWPTVAPGDWIIKGIAGEFYPCKADVFAATYEAVNE